MIKVFLIAILLTIAASKLYQVTSLFRHGARYHLNPLDDGNSTLDMWGELSPVGMRQHQTLGKTLNKQYIQNRKFLSEKYVKKEIQVFSTDINRTISSALSQLYGLYPPGNGPRLQYVQRKYHLPPFATNQSDLQQQNFAFPEGHQHIMVNFDPKLLLQNCPKYNQLVQKNIQIHSQQYAEMNLTYTPFMKRLIQLFNLSSNSTFQTACELYDTLNVDKFMGRPLPDGFSADDFLNIEHLNSYINNMKFSGLAAKIFNTGKFVKILNQFDNRIKNLTGYPLKWTFLSAHDTDIIPAQTALNFSSFQCIQDLYRKGKTDALNCQINVGFASSLIFQLHSDNDKDFYVMVRSQGKYMNLCQKQSTKCSYTEFKNRLKNYIVPNPEQLCGVKDPMYKDLKKQVLQAFEYKII